MRGDAAVICYIPFCFNRGNEMEEISNLRLRDYQRAIYPYLYDTLNKNDYCILVTTTGTGKSFLTIKYLLDLKKRFIK